MAQMPLALEVEDVTVSFSGNRALNSVHLSVGAGSVVGLVGENGAGKSTLIKCLAGVYQPDGGQVFVDGNPLRPHTAAQAEALGIATVHQESNLRPADERGRERHARPSAALVRDRRRARAGARGLQVHGLLLGASVVENLGLVSLAARAGQASSSSGSTAASTP